MIERPEYMNKLISFKDKRLIKVITGIRRCGKSTLFTLFCEYLKSVKVSDKQIIRINLEDPDYKFNDYKELYDYVNSRIIPGKMNYIFIDEVQNVPEFQRACDGLYIKENVDLYITGSNAYLLSGELATLLSGRYVEIKMLPLSFKEYTSRLGESDLMKKYNDYLVNSSFPYTLELQTREQISSYLEGIYNTIVLKDIATRKNIIDVATLQSIIYFMFDNIGNMCSSNKISNMLASSGKRISVPTVEIYLNALVDAFILYRVDRYDIKGKQYLVTGHKYYLSDIGLRYYLLGNKKADQGHILENIVYLELIRRGYRVYIGKNETNEIDFVTENIEGTQYFQVAYTVHDEKTLERELKPLNSIGDHNSKYLLTMDFIPNTSHNGIKQLNILEWLINK